jgi:energy-coupling factor transporter ATP-binding protein EcfA2
VLGSAQSSAAWRRSVSQGAVEEIFGHNGQTMLMDEQKVTALRYCYCLGVPTIRLPGKTLGSQADPIEDARIIVIVGANGSGKSRLGRYIEEQGGSLAHRISAQRSLVVPLQVPMLTRDHAEKMVQFGMYQSAWTDDTNYIHHKLGNRWQGEPNSSMLNDYQHMLAYLFADQVKRDQDYAVAAQKMVPVDHPPRCKLDTLQKIWSAVMPQRGLKIADHQLKAILSGGDNAYDARQMSDGERVAIYLMGQALCTPPNGIAIIDEPEIHLHRAIQSLLWNQLEAARPDCTFVYITHDLEFAASRSGARRIWVKDFDGTAWNWDEIEAIDTLPDVLTMQILGARRPVLFVEGDESGLDKEVYSLLFPEEHVVSRASANKVVEATKAINALPRFHMSARGIVDRDRREDEEIAALRAAGVSVLAVAEIENLMCIPEALVAVAQYTCEYSSQRASVVDRAKSAVLAELKKQQMQQVMKRVLYQIQFHLNGFGPKLAKSDAAVLQHELSDYVKKIDVVQMASADGQRCDEIIEKADYVSALRRFNCKGIIALVARCFDVTPSKYTEFVLRKLREAPAGDMAMAMRKLSE